MQNIKTNSPVTVTKRFDISSIELWDLISTPGNLNDCHPFCHTNEILEWSDEVHTDRLVYLNGRTYIRRFQTWEKGRGYTLLIGEQGGLQSFVEWSINSISESESQLTISVHPFLLAGIPKIVSYIPYVFWVKPKLRSYLKSVLSGFEYFSRTHKAVPRNHFGRHSWFS
tara:strand:- start:1137 stop:1643 length:507 start_codon:yes stop_codon:yes gene_type:complete